MKLTSTNAVIEVAKYLHDLRLVALKGFLSPPIAESCKMHPETWMRLRRDMTVRDWIGQAPLTYAGIRIDKTDDLAPGIIKFFDADGREIGVKAGK